MNRIDRLIAELCPEGVEFKEISKLAIVGTGSKDRKDATPDGQYPFYVRSKEVFKINSFEFDEEAILIPGEGGIGEIFHFVTGKYALHQRAYRISFRDDLINTKFAYYFFYSNFKSFILTKAVNATVSSIRKPMIMDFRMPVPPLEVQHEIVRILDTFSQLEAELEAELEARRLQYQHYRDELLNFEGRGDVKWAALGDFAHLVRGNGLPKSDFVESGVGAIHYGQIYTHYGTWATHTKSFVASHTAKKLAKVDPGDIVITNTSENIEDVGKAVAWIGDDQVVTGGHATVIKHNQNPKFLAYCFQTEWFNQSKRKLAIGTKVIDVSAKSLAKIEMPIPTLKEQAYIVSILDEFDAMVNDLSSGLPAEIQARRQQYEYYRDRLLSFKEAG